MLREGVYYLYSNYVKRRSILPVYIAIIIANNSYIIVATIIASNS